jgi:hypothetical protein
LPRDPLVDAAGITVRTIDVNVALNGTVLRWSGTPSISMPRL